MGSLSMYSTPLASQSCTRETMISLRFSWSFGKAVALKVMELPWRLVTRGAPLRSRISPRAASTVVVYAPRVPALAPEMRVE